MQSGFGLCAGACAVVSGKLGGRRAPSVYRTLSAVHPSVNLRWRLLRAVTQDADNKGREEWMLVPPKSLGVLGAIKTLQPTNRKFQT